MMKFKHWPLPRYCNHHSTIYYRALRSNFPSDKVRVFHDTVDICCELDQEFFDLNNQVINVIHKANAEYVIQLLDLKLKFGDEYAQLLDVKRCDQLIEEKVLRKIEHKSNSKIILDRNGGVNIFGSTLSILKARSLLNNFFQVPLLGEDVPPLNHFPELQQDPQKEKAPVEIKSNENVGKTEIPNDPTNFTLSPPGRQEFRSYVRFMINRQESGLVIGTKGYKRQEFQNNFNVLIVVHTDNVNSMNQIAVEIRGKSVNSINQAKEAILQHLKKFDNPPSFFKK